MMDKGDASTSGVDAPLWTQDGAGRPIFLRGDDLCLACDEWMAGERRVEAEFLRLGAIAWAVSRAGKYGHKSLEKLAQMLGKSYTVLDNRKQVYGRIADLEISDRSEIMAKLKTGQTNYTKLLRCAPIADDRTFLDVATRVEPNGKPASTTQVRDEAKVIKAAQRASNLQTIAQANPLLPMLRPGQYRTIVIDPPWQMEMARTGTNRHRSRNWDMYSYMTEEELRDLEPMRTLPAERCHLYLWTTHKHLEAALRLVDAWDFRFCCVLTWIKNRGMVSYSFKYDTELVIFATRRLSIESAGESQYFFGEARQHSRKPETFYEIVRRVSPAPRVDLFSREDREGFDSWGDQQGMFARLRLPLAEYGYSEKPEPPSKPRNTHRSDCKLCCSEATSLHCPHWHRAQAFPIACLEKIIDKTLHAIPEESVGSEL